MIELKHVSKVFETAGGRVEALKDISLTIPDGDVYGIIGMSGAGKSTLVRCINMLERPTSGEVIVNGKRLDTMSPAQLRAARRDITMIFQRFNLLMRSACPTRRRPIPRSSPAVSSSASPLPARWRRTPRSCCATKRPARSTPRRHARFLS